MPVDQPHLECDWDPVYWRLNLHTFAQWVSAGDWVAWNYIRQLSMMVQRKVIAGNARIILNMPPQHGKSFLLSKWLPAWFLHWWPTKRVLLASYEAGFASDWGGKVLNLFTDPESELISQVRSNKRASNDWETLEGGGMKTGGIGGSFTGRGGDLLIFDDPHKNYEEAMSEAKIKAIKTFYEKTFWTRRAPGCSIIVVMTRWHDSDMTAHLLEDWSFENWTHINVKALCEEGDVDPFGRVPGQALCPDRYTAEDLLIIKENKPHTFNGMYQGNPVPIEGSVWKFPWLRFWTEIPDQVDLWVQSWDCAFKKGERTSFGVGQVWAICGADRYLVHQVRGRWSFVELCEQVEAVNLEYPQAFLKLVEDKANGSAVMSALERLGGFQAVNPTDSKVGRAISVSGEFKTGHVFLPLPHTRSWVADCISEITRFPLSKHNDQVDAMSQLLNEVRKIMAGMPRSSYAGKAKAKEQRKQVNPYGKPVEWNNKPRPRRRRRR